MSWRGGVRSELEKGCEGVSWRGCVGVSWRGGVRGELERGCKG